MENGESKMTKDNIGNGIKINETLVQEFKTHSQKEEIVDSTIEDYLLKQLKIIDEEITDEKKKLIKKNFVHLMCQVLSDLNLINERLRKYKEERTKLENIKSNEAEYTRRKLEYFAKLNKNAQNDIITFLVKDINRYLIETNYDTLQRESENDECEKLYRNRWYRFAQFSEYYDAEFDYSTVVKASQFPGVDLIDRPETEQKYLKLYRDDPEQYFDEIRKMIEQKKIVESLREQIAQNYHLHKRHEIFEDLAALYEGKHYQSFIALGLLQLEGIFFDICSIKYDEKENVGSLVEKAEKALTGKNEISFMRYYPYFAFDVPIKRNEIAHTGFMKSQNLEKIADELLLDLYAVAQMAKMESDGKFRIFLMINEALNEIESSDIEKLNKKLIVELFKNQIIDDESFWNVLKSPDQFKEEIEFYKLEELPEGQVDLPTIVKEISEMIYREEFWTELLKMLEYNNEEINQFVLKMANNYIKVLSGDSKKKCIEIFQYFNI